MNATGPQKILVVEDEAKLAGLMADYLRAAGFEAHTLDDGSQVVAWVRDQAPALILLDLMLPGQDGLSICREIRTFSQVPIIMTTARVEEIDRLLGLELGADDYICKPYSPREVVARVRAVLRRLAPAGAITAPGPIVLDAERLRVRAGEREVELTAVEFHLLAALMRQPGRILSRGQLMNQIYDDQRIVSDRTIDSHIKKLRRKLAELLPDEELIHAVYGVGYRFEPSEGGSS
jgi:two-component system response regulator BaeR